MTIFQSLVYPDNERRAQRVFDLSNDCILYFQQLTAQKPQLENAFAEIEKTHGKLGLPVPAEQDMPFLIKISDDWAINTLPTIGKMILKAGIKYSMAAAASSALVQAGGKAPSALRPFLQAPPWFLGNEVAQGLTAAAVADLIISAIQGASQRAKLQEMIHSMVDPRLRAALLVRRNDVLLEGLRSISAALAVIGRTSAYKAADKDEQRQIVDAVVEKCLEDLTARLSKIDDQAVIPELTQLDSQRGSFTAEDGEPPSSERQ